MSILERRSATTIPTEPSYYLQMLLPESVMEDDETKRRPLDHALAVFKLFKNAIVMSNYVLITRNGRTETTYWRHYVHYARVKPVQYYLSEKDEAEFRTFWKEFDSLEMSSFPVYRFHLAEIRPYLRDRFSDFIESLEYLLVPDSGEGEIAFKFRLRGALILSPPENRREVYENLRDSYDLRSAIVHGNTNREGELIRKRAWEEWIDLVRDYNRRVLVQFFRSGCLGDRTKRRDLLLQRELNP
jgi:hypothetical protein